MSDRGSVVYVDPRRSATTIGLTEDGLAAAFEAAYAGKVLYAHIFGRWYFYQPETGIWREDGQELVAHWVREFVRGLNTEQRAQWAKAAVIDAVSRMARRAPPIAASGLEFDANPDLLGTPGGVFDLRSGERIKPSPELMISRSTAVGPASGTPRLWLRFLLDATGEDVDLIDYLQRLAGYCFTGHASEETLHFLYGPGGNGKGVINGALLGIAGAYGKQASMETFIRPRGDRHPADLADLVGARLVVAAESAEGDRWDEQRVKMATGRDRISARFMRQDFFEFQPQFSLLVASNHKPRIGTVDDAWRRRLHLIPFDRKPAKPDPELKDKLREEWPQILGWVLEGAEWWFREGLAPPESVTAATEAYLCEEDVIGMWFREHCEAAPGVKTSRSDLYGSFERWCGDMGHAASSMHKVSRWLRANGFDQVMTDAKRPFAGIRLI